MTTRGVAEAAGVQAPAIYRFFGDKDGLLEAVAEHVMATYVSAKAAMVQSTSLGGSNPGRPALGVADADRLRRF